jgi:exportin-5
MYTQETVDLLRKLYEWCVVDPHDIDYEKYLLAKKFSEVSLTQILSEITLAHVKQMLSNLGNFIEQKTSVIPEDCDLPNLFNLFLTIVQSQSFVVSIPILVTWTRLLRSEDIGGSPTVNPLIAPLLETCSSRLVRYENFPEDSDDPSLVFLLDDIDTIPERHAFLGNYRRYSVMVIEYIVRWKQSDAIYHILSQAAHTMEHLYDDRGPFAGIYSLCL